MDVRVLTDGTFNERVSKSKGISVVDFFANWCMPCKIMAPIIESLAAELDGTVSFFKLDVDENQSTAGRLGIRSIPTFIVFRNGKEIDRMVGGMSEESFRDKIDSFL